MSAPDPKLSPLGERVAKALEGETPLPAVPGVRLRAVESMHPGEMWVVPVAEPPPAPFAQAFSELRAVIAHPSVIDRREALARWKRRWIDEGAVLVSVTPIEELQQIDDKARAVQMARLILGRDGMLGRETHRPAGGGAELRLFLCAVRAEPKTGTSAVLEPEPWRDPKY